MQILLGGVIMASEADIIATLYFDSMDIYRKEKVK